MIHPQRERIAAVLGASQGSGYLLTPWLVLTSAHLLGDDGRQPQVAVPGRTGLVRCRVVWSCRDDACDAALLVADGEDIIDEGHPPVWTRVDDLVPRPGAFAVGFPRVQRDAAGELDSEQLSGTLKPGTNILTGSQVIDSLHHPPTRDGRGGSPWAGMSGAPVFLEGRLAGVIRADPIQWQHGRLVLTSAATLLDRPDFHRACRRHGYTVESFRSPVPGSESFEERLRDELGQQASQLQIIGLNPPGGEEEFWPLDTSYLSLELLDGSQSRSASGQDAAGVLAQRAEVALAGRNRVLLRGTAGSGKTTLLQWLTVSASRRDLPPSLSDLDGCVPLLLRLRSIAPGSQLPRPEHFLSLAAPNIAGDQDAAGWVISRLREGRILLLIDGVDEVPANERPRTRVWLRDLIRSYPDARYVVTTRPSAVMEGWLSALGFSELELLPMGRGDVTAFIAKWHQAVALLHPEDERIAGWQQSITAAVAAKEDLRRLATNPLLCALICALNRDRHGALPEGRMELYEAALTIMLDRRERERRIAAPPGIPLGAKDLRSLLKRLAYWLVRNHAAEIPYGHAAGLVADALPLLRRVQATPEEVLNHLIDRTGLLRQPTTDSVDFVHRTFQDYLAAEAAVEQRDLGQLVHNAHDDQWEDVVRMAVGHARPNERANLLKGLLRKARLEWVWSERLLILAASCLEHAGELDLAVRAQVEAAAAELIPPRDLAAAHRLAAAGTGFLDLLPGPAELSDETAAAVVEAALQTADARCMPLLSRYTGHRSRDVRSRLAVAWSRFDTQEYGEQIIAGLSYDDDLFFSVTSPGEVDFLDSLGGRPRILRTDVPANQAVDLPAPQQIEELVLQQLPAAVRLDTITECTSLRNLTCIKTSLDVSLLSSLSVRSLTLRDGVLNGFVALRSLNGLARVHFDGSHIPERFLSCLPASVREVSLLMNRGQITFYETAHLTRLERLEFDFTSVSPSRREPLLRFPALRSLTIRGELMMLLTESLPVPLPNVEHLTLRHPMGVVHLPTLARWYPGLRKLTLQGVEPSAMSGLEHWRISNSEVELEII